MASVGSAGGGSSLVPSYSEQDVRQAVELVTELSTEALQQEKIATYSYAQLAEGLVRRQGRVECAVRLILAPFGSAVLSIFALGKFLTGHAFWSSETEFPFEESKVRLAKRFTAWGKDLYDGIVQYPVTAVIWEIAFFTGIIAPKLQRKFAPAIRAVALTSHAELRTIACDAQFIFERSLVGQAVRTLLKATGNPKVIQWIQDIKKTDSTISADAIAKKILQPAPSGKGEA